MSEPNFITGIDKTDIFGRHSTGKKYQNPNHCDDCNEEFNPPLSKEMLEYQKKYKDNYYTKVSCDNCISKNHTLTDEELGIVKKEKQINKLVN